MPILSEILNVFHGRVLRSMHMNKKWTTIFDYFDTIPDVYNMVIWLKVIFNSLALGDILGGYMTSSTLFQVMACWLTAPSHYQDQCWFVFIETFSEIYASGITHWNMFGNYTFEITMSLSWKMQAWRPHAQYLSLMIWPDTGLNLPKWDATLGVGARSEIHGSLMAVSRSRTIETKFMRSGENLIFHSKQKTCVYYDEPIKLLFWNL